ncbi:MAG: T9SS type A sorting domain-containing protein, partial [Bacteroidia bacterium]
ENEPYTRRSTDNGTTWDSVQQWRNLPGAASHQFVASLGETVHLAWHDERNPTNKEIYYRASNDSGATFAAEELVSNAPGESSVPILGTTTNYVHAIWSDDRSGSFKPWYSRRGISVITSIPNVSNSVTDIKVYPNPARQSFTVEYTQENFDLIITDLTGRYIYEQKNISGKTQIDSKDFTSGIYFIHISNGKNNLNTKLIITK